MAGETNRARLERMAADHRERAESFYHADMPVAAALHEQSAAACEVGAALLDALDGVQEAVLKVKLAVDESGHGASGRWRKG